jgi:hypothetical protein
MLPIAALIVTDDSGARFSGLDLNERAALAAHRAGIHHAYFTGHHQPDIAALHRLRARGVFATPQFGWPRLFAELPAARLLVVLEARTIVEPDGLKAAVEDASRAPHDATLVVNLGPDRKNSLIRVTDGRVVSVMHDGNAMSAGITVIPGDLIGKIRGVWSMQDAIHRLSKGGNMRALSAAPYFCVPLAAGADIPAVARAYYRHTTCAAISQFAGRLFRWPNLQRIRTGEA